MNNYIGVLIERKNGVLTNAVCLGIRELIKNNSHNSVWLQANGSCSYGHYVKQHSDGYLYSHEEHTDKWDATTYSTTLKYYPTNKPMQMTKWQLKREQERKQEELLDSAKLFLHYLAKELVELEKFNQLVSEGIKQDKKITGSELVFLADYYKVEIPIRTRGYYLNKLHRVTATEIKDKEVLRISYATEGKLNRDILYKTLDLIVNEMYPEEVTAEEQKTFNRLFKVN
jgi:hypothetical protein